MLFGKVFDGFPPLVEYALSAKRDVTQSIWHKGVMKLPQEKTEATCYM